MYNKLKRSKISDEEHTADKDKYKPISGKLKDHFGWELMDGSIKNCGNVYCFHCDKSFVFQGSNASLMYHLQKKHKIHYQTVHSKSKLLSSDYTPSLPNQTKP